MQRRMPCLGQLQLASPTAAQQRCGGQAAVLPAKIRKVKDRFNRAIACAFAAPPLVLTRAGQLEIRRGPFWQDALLTLDRHLLHRVPGSKCDRDDPLRHQDESPLLACLLKCQPCRGHDRWHVLLADKAHVGQLCSQAKTANQHKIVHA